MNSGLADFLDRPWGLAMAILMLLVPRWVARSRDPLAMRRAGSARLLTGYAAAIAAALASVALAEPLHLRSWVDAIPVRPARELAAASPFLKYLFAAMVAWLLVAYLVAPMSAWLASHGRGHGVLVAAICLPFAIAMGASLSFAWLEPLKELPFTLASTCCLVLVLVIGFSVGAKLPLGVRRAGADAT